MLRNELFLLNFLSNTLQSPFQRAFGFSNSIISIAAYSPKELFAVLNN